MLPNEINFILFYSIYSNTLVLSNKSQNIVVKNYMFWIKSTSINLEYDVKGSLKLQVNFQLPAILVKTYKKS